MIRSFIVEQAEETKNVGFAILSPEAEGLWKVVWASPQLDTPDPFTGSLPATPQHVEWSAQPQAMGVALASQLQPLGVLAWPCSTSQLTDLTKPLEACREIFWRASEQKWIQLLSSLLAALAEQRRDIGSAIHRGPAQALTAARLELSMMGEGVAGGAMGQALDRASEELIRIVHGKLRARGTSGSLAANLRAELDFQVRWRDLPASDSAVALPKIGLNGALADLWRLAGGQVVESADEATFVLDGVR